jgi:hypothetical protein
MIIIFLLYTIALVLLLKKSTFFQTSALGGWGMYIAIFVKIVVALFFFYLPYDTMIDSPAYMHDSEVLSRVLYSHPADFFRLFLGMGDVQNLNEVHLSETTYWSHDKGWIFSDTRNVIRINAIFQWLAFHNPLVILLFNVLVALFGLRLIFLSIQNATQSKSSLLFILLFFLPSTLLWTANIMKENYMLLGLGLVLYFWFKREIRALRNFGLVAGFLMLLLFKPYVAVALLMAWLLFTLINVRVAKWRWAAFIVLGMLGLGAATFFTGSVTTFISKKQHDFINLSEGGLWLQYENGLARVSNLDANKVHVYEHTDQNFYAQFSDTLKAEYRAHGIATKEVQLLPNNQDWYVFHNLPESGSYIALTPIQNRWQQLLKNIPQALGNVLFRPLPNDPPKSILKWYFVLENLLIWAIIGLGLWRFKASKYKYLVVSLFAAALLIALFIGWTTPVLGAIVRYKLPVILLIFAASWLLLYPKQTENTETK